MLIKIAWRNIWRSKLRSAVVIMAIAFGLLGGLFAAAWMYGMTQQRVQNSFSIETAHVQMHHPEFADNFDITKTIENTSQKIEEIKSLLEVIAITPRLKIAGMAATSNKNVGVTVIGVYDKTESEVFKLYQKIDSTQGNFLKNERKNAIVISQSLAEDLKAKLRSRIVLTFQDYNGEITGAAFRVVGIYKTSNTPWDKMHVFVKDTDLRKVSEVPDNMSHEIAMVLNDYEQAETFASLLNKKYPEDLTEGWLEIQPYLNIVTNYMDVIMGIFMIIILGALGFGIVNTMLMVILERTKEIGMLMAIGMTKKRLFMMIMYETIFLALVGAVIGEIMSFGVISYFGNVGIDLSTMADGLEAVGYSPITYPALAFDKYVLITIWVIITGIIASIYPALKALKLDPASAIRSV